LREISRKGRFFEIFLPAHPVRARSSRRSRAELRTEVGRIETDLDCGRPMPVLPRILGLLAMTSALSLAVWLGHYSRWSDTAASQAAPRFVCDLRPPPVEDSPPPVSESWLPVVASKPPYPKAMIEEELFDFGTAHPRETKSHSVCIRNVGDAPLILYQPPAGWWRGWHRTLRPGETSEYEFEWKTSEIGTGFVRTAVLLTNDPQRPKIEMMVVGRGVFADPESVGNGFGILP
jgi:hypothetical protein